MKFVSCLGGWCALRDRCLFHRQSSSQFISERRCLPGEDGVYLREGAYQVVPLVPRRPAEHPTKEQEYA